MNSHPSRTLATLSRALLLLTLLAAPLAAAQTPTVDELLDRFIAAQGGEEALARHDSQSWTGTFSIPAAGLEGTVSMKMMAPNFLRVDIEAPGLGTISEGFSDGVAWQDSVQTGPRVMTGAEAEMRRIGADYRGALAFKENFATLEVLGEEEFDGQPCWKMRTVTEMGTEMMQFFSQDSGMMIGSSGPVPTAMGDIQVTSILSRFEEIDGVTYPKVTTQEMMGTAQILELETVVFDTLGTADFELPPAIKAIAAAGAD